VSDRPTTVSSEPVRAFANTSVPFVQRSHRDIRDGNYILFVAEGSSEKQFLLTLKHVIESDAPFNSPFDALTREEVSYESQTSTLPREILNPANWKKASAEMKRLLALAHDESFEDGVRGPFARELERFLSVHVFEAIDLLQRYAFSEGANAAVVGEIIRYVGMSNDPLTKDERLQFLTRCLAHRSPIVRDASGIGIAHLNDRRALRDILEAIKREQYTELRDDLRLVANQLESY
jgi:hypothetical protein